MEPSEKLNKAYEREESILEDELSSGEISQSEYSERAKELEREAREYYREEQNYGIWGEQDYYHQ